MGFKLVKINAPFRSYLRKFDDPCYEGLSYQELKEILEWDGVFHAGSWSYYLNRLGYEADEIYSTVRPLQMKWADAHSFKCDGRNWKREIAVEQIKAYKPEIVLSSDWDMSLVKAVRSEVPSVKLVLGWIGSYIPAFDGWRDCDCILSPAPEAVHHLNKNGFRALHLNHGFDVRLLERTKAKAQSFDFTFSGAFLLTPGTHRNRVEIVDGIIRRFRDIRLGIFTDERQSKEHLEKYSGTGMRSTIKRKIKVYLGLTSKEERFGWTQETGINKAAIRRILAHNLGEVYGIDMLGVLQQSKIAFNSHANSSPTHASNLRLFEATGSGACVLTDWKDNLNELFEPDSEVATYRSAEEAVNKVGYLMRHENERKTIAEQGQRRTLRDHTLDVRAEELDTIIRKLLMR